MLFNSYPFIFAFLPVCLAGYALMARLGRRPAMIWLVLASLFFFGWWDSRYVLPLVALMGINYAFGKLVSRTRSSLALALGVAFNVAILAYFKYLLFFANTLRDMTGIDAGVQAVVLPLGISFFTFQKIAYLIDCKRGKVVPHTWLEFSLFVTFFPQLIAGPIVHQAEILPQLTRHGRLRLRALDLAVGLSMFAAGLFKKVVLADGIAIFATPVFAAAAQGQELTLLEAWGGAVAYTLQLYFDFSGYSDMAIGLGRLFGVRLPANFASPYKSTNIIEFWRRWHMTLSRFLRDYIYFPLGGNRRGPWSRYRNLMLVMMIGGLWHGAGWTFVIWGTLHGLYLVVNHAWRGLGGALPAWLASQGWWRVVSWVMTFVAIVVAWVFFRADSLHSALVVLKGMAGLNGLAVPVEMVARMPGVQAVLEALNVTVVSGVQLPHFHGLKEIATLTAGVLFTVVMPNTQEWLAHYRPTYKAVARPRLDWYYRLMWRPTNWWAAASAIVLVIAVINVSDASEFLYFQF